MASLTQQTDRIRRRKRSSNGKAKKRARSKIGTPKFPIHPESAETAK